MPNGIGTYIFKNILVFGCGITNRLESIYFNTKLKACGVEDKIEERSNNNVMISKNS